MSRHHLLARLLVIGMAVAGSAVDADADLILLSDRREIAGEAFSFAGSGFDILNFSDAAQFGAPWTLSRDIHVQVGAATAAATATQLSVTGPLRFSGLGSVTASAFRTSTQDTQEYTGASAKNSYDIEFLLTSPYAVTWTAIVEAFSLGAEPHEDPLAFAFIQLPSPSSLLPAIGTTFSNQMSSGSGILPPGYYSLFGSAWAEAVGREGMPPRIGTATFRFDVGLSPVTPVPEPATFALVAAGGALAASTRARRARKRLLR